MIGFYNYTVWLTYISFLSALIGIYFSFNDNPFYAIICLMFSGFCDMFDGMVARTKKDRTNEEKRFGIQISPPRNLLPFPAKISAVSAAEWRAGHPTGSCEDPKRLSPPKAPHR